MNNILEKHVNKTKKRFKKYCSLILKSKYDKTISEELIQTYIDARYYNYGVDKKIKVFYMRILDALKNRAVALVKKEPTKKDIVENTLMLFQYFIYFDFVRKNVEIEEIVSKISEKRASKLNLKIPENDDFEKKFTKLVQDDIKAVDKLFEIYDSKDFELEVKEVGDKDSDFYKVKLKYNFDFPKIYAKEVIEETFCTDIVGEDKLFVEYPMVAIRVLKDVLEGDFKKVYIVEFTSSLLKKSKKLDNVIGILENQIAQEKINIEITYNDFLENKKQVYAIMKKGFNFTLRTDSEMPKLSASELKILEIFNCILADSKDVNKKKYKKSKVIEM